MITSERPPLSASILRCPTDLDAIESAYIEFERQLGPSASVFQTWTWFLHHTTGATVEVLSSFLVVLVRRREELCAVIPFRGPQMTPVGRVKVRAIALLHERAYISCAQALPNTDPTELLECVFAALQAHVAAWDVLVLPRQIPESALFSAQYVRHCLWATNWRSGSIHWLPTDGTYDSYLATLSKNFRSNLRKMQKRLSSSRVEFRHADKPGDALQSALDEFFRLEARGWKQLTEHRLPAFRLLMMLAVQQGWARVDTLYIDGVLAAATLSLLKPSQRLYVYKIAYNENVSRYSPGILLTDYLLRECFASREIAAFDLMSNGDWHLPFKPVAYELRTTMIFRSTWRGLGSAAMTKLLNFLRGR